MRKLSNSTPTVINTELRPFDESFRIDANGQLEQWFYDNTSQYVPDRTVAVLTLTPVLSVYDADTDKSYTTASTQGEEDYIAFYYLQWYVNEYNGTTYQETLITSSSDGAGVNYFTQGNNLIVKKNVSYAHAVTIRCVATYIDPRDAGITYSVEDSVILSCSRDATVVLPEVAIVSPSARSFNPLVDGYTTENGVEVQNTEYEFEGTVTNSPAVERVTSSDLAEYKVDGWGTEEIESASGSCSPTLTIRYPDGSIETDARFMCRKTADGTKLDVSGNAFVTNIKGNTVKWSQKLVQTTVTTSSYFANLSEPFNAVSGRKYYVSFNAVMTENGSRNVVLGNGNSFVSNTITVTCTANKKIRVEGVVTASYTGSVRLKTANAGISMTISRQIVVDLSLLYGLKNEPSAATFAADYLKWYGKSLVDEPQQAAKIRPVKMVSMKTGGFNLWDEQWAKLQIKMSGDDTNFPRLSAKNYIKVVAGEQYRFFLNRDDANTSNRVDIWFYDMNKNIMSYLALTARQNFTPPTGACYARFSMHGFYGSDANLTYHNDICIHHVGNGTNSNVYMPYWSNKAMLNVTELKGRVVTNGQATGNLVTIFPDGMKRARNVYDEIYMENGKIYAKKRVGAIDLGTLNWSENSADYITYSAPISGYAFIQTFAGISNFVSDRYIDGSVQNMSEQAATMAVRSGAIHVITTVATAAAFKTSAAGSIVYCELTNPVTYEIDEIQSPFIFKWFGINSSGQEVDATTMPWYKEGQDTSKLKVDAMYGENINVVLRCTKGAGLNELSPSKAFASLSWRVPEIDCHVISYNGGAVRVGDDNDELAMRFGTTINVRGQVLSEARRNAHLRLNWKYRHSNSPEENDVGWDNEIEIPNNNLIHVRGTGGGTLASTLVYPYVYLLGPWKPATSTTTPYTKPTTTKDGASYERTID